MGCIIRLTKEELEGGSVMKCSVEAEMAVWIICLGYCQATCSHSQSTQLVLVVGAGGNHKAITYLHDAADL